MTRLKTLVLAVLAAVWLVASYISPAKSDALSIKEAKLSSIQIAQISGLTAAEIPWNCEVFYGPDGQCQSVVCNPLQWGDPYSPINPEFPTIYNCSDFGLPDPGGP